MANQFSLYRVIINPLNNKSMIDITKYIEIIHCVVSRLEIIDKKIKTMEMTISNIGTSFKMSETVL